MGKLCVKRQDMVPLMNSRRTGFVSRERPPSGTCSEESELLVLIGKPIRQREKGGGITDDLMILEIRGSGSTKACMRAPFLKLTLRTLPTQRLPSTFLSACLPFASAS